MSDTEKRSMERHFLEEFIHLEGGLDIISGRTVDVSRNGMKVRVGPVDELAGLSHVSVNLPGSGGEGIPCRIRRREQGDDHWEIGLEFDGENDARMLLVERWLESLENRRPETDSAPTESRQVPRTRCTLRDVRCTDGSVKVLSAEDISLDGLLLRARGNVRRGDRLALAMRLDGSDRDIAFTGRVAYVSDDPGENAAVLSLGVAVEDMREIDRNRLRAFIIEIASGAAMLEYQKLLERGEPGEEYRIESAEAENLLGEVARRGLTVNLLDEGGLRILETRCEPPRDGRFRAAAPEPASEGSTTAFFSFILDSSSYSFTAERIGWSDGTGWFALPSGIYRGEKRAGLRREGAGSVILEFGNGLGSVPGRIVDSSRRGVLCEVERSAFPDTVPEAGMPVELVTEGKAVPGELRHVLVVQGTPDSADGDGTTRMRRDICRIGIETGIRRKTPETRLYDEKEWNDAWNGPQRALGDPSILRPRRVEYTDRSGRRIAALLHMNPAGEKDSGGNRRASGAPPECTVVVIPPAFGKKKEALAPLALALMAHFDAAGENVAVLRYDGIDKPGESDNANAHARRGYEMLSYRIDQGYEDLEATMRWVRENDLFRAGRTVLISFSMAALDARRLQSNPRAPRADYWISVMGVSSSQGALRNILGGLDVIANHRMGLPIGTMGMLGQLIDMDRLAADMTRLGYAVAADARWTMSRVESPVTWIFGAFDKWMIPEEIRDIMSVESPGLRELIEIPTAHNLRSSDDALKAFAMIADAILRRCRGRSVPPVAPDKGEMLDLITRERERITAQESLDAKRYWKGYLVGEGDSDEGYDFYRRLAEFREFLQVEVDLLDPRPGESVADMGCGTGLVSEAILSRLAEVAGNGTGLKGTRFTAVDLVKEALEKAEAKYQLLCRSHPALEAVDDGWIAMDLEPDALAGIRRCAGRSDAAIEDLRDRVNGLSAETVDRLADRPRDIVAAYLGGARMTPAQKERAEAVLETGDILLLDDINRAARFVLGRLEEEDLKPSRRRRSGPIDPARLDAIRTSDLHTAVLDFGDWGRDGRLPVEDGAFDAIAASLFLSYLFAPGEAVREFARMLRPGGRLVLSTMKPDSDISAIFTRYIAEQSVLDARSAADEEREKNLREARSMLNEAASLFSLEEDGWFRFFDRDELIGMMRNAGFTDIKYRESLGNPAQAIIVSGRKA